MTRNLATLRESQLLPPFTRGCLKFITLTCRALSRNHIASPLVHAITMLCFNQTVEFPLPAPVLTWLFLAQGKYIEHSLFTNLCHAQIHSLPRVSSSFCSAQTSVQGPLRPTLRANLFPKVTDLFCRLPLPTLFYKPEAVNLGDLMRLWVRTGVQIKACMWLFKDS